MIVAFEAQKQENRCEQRRCRCEDDKIQIYPRRYFGVRYRSDFVGRAQAHGCPVQNWKYRNGLRSPEISVTNSPIASMPAEVSAQTVRGSQRHCTRLQV